MFRLHLSILISSKINIDKYCLGKQNYYYDCILYIIILYIHVYILTFWFLFLHPTNLLLNYHSMGNNWIFRSILLTIHTYLFCPQTFMKCSNLLIIIYKHMPQVAWIQYWHILLITILLNYSILIKKIINPNIGWIIYDLEYGN